MAEKTTLLHLSIIAALACIVFSNTLSGSFIYDDHMVRGFAAVKDFGKILRMGLPQVFSTGARGLFFRPLFLASLFTDYSIWGLQPFGYHLTSIVLHIINCLLLYFLVLSISGSRTVSLIAACLFAVHPVQAESVAWISGRNDLLVASFAFTSFLCHIRGRTVWSCIALLAALLTKESALVLIALFPLYDMIVTGKPRKAAYTGLLITILVYSAARFIALTGMGTGNITFGTALVKNLATAPLFYLKYLGFLLYPSGYAFLQPPVLINDGNTIVHLAVSCIAAGSLCAGYFFIRKIPAFAFSFAWFIILLVPYSGIIPMPWPVMEHRLYLAGAGFFIMVAYLLCRLIQSRRRGTRLLGHALAVILIAAYAFTTFHKNELFASEVTVWKETVRNNPMSRDARANLVDAYIDSGLFDPALAELKELVRIDGSVWTFHCAMANIYTLKGDHASAVAALEKTLVLHPPDPEAIHALLRKERTRLNAGAERSL